MVSVLLKLIVNVLLKRMVSTFACEKCFSYTEIIQVAFIYCYSLSFHCFFHISLNKRMLKFMDK